MRLRAASRKSMKMGSAVFRKEGLLMAIKIHLRQLQLKNFYVLMHTRKHKQTKRGNERI